jgi:hypothetical protein
LVVTATPAEALMSGAYFNDIERTFDKDHINRTVNGLVIKGLNSGLANILLLSLTADECEKDPLFPDKSADSEAMKFPFMFGFKLRGDLTDFNIPCPLDRTITAFHAAKVEYLDLETFADFLEESWHPALRFLIHVKPRSVYTRLQLVDYVPPQPAGLLYILAVFLTRKQPPPSGFRPSSRHLFIKRLDFE